MDLGRDRTETRERRAGTTRHERGRGGVNARVAHHLSNFERTNNLNNTPVRVTWTLSSSLSSFSISDGVVYSIVYSSLIRVVGTLQLMESALLIVICMPVPVLCTEKYFFFAFQRANRQL
uniref:Transmembrane protein n=1 Tax=Heterorhabditis bacteriophora TaxID=37862 RepID=A0A1I7X7L3_HETBA